ncbi:hypothetical protein, partial [Streptomyces sp. 049-1]|uniref:hypothetical protein n=1 Tax=Streptomyces sp. 049-1 TaxID=2789264 RepID=UPI00397F8A9B
MVHVVALSGAVTLSVRTVVALRVRTGAMLCMLARASLRRMLPHTTGVVAVVMFRCVAVAVAGAAFV